MQSKFYGGNIDFMGFALLHYFCVLADFGILRMDYSDSSHFRILGSFRHKASIFVFESSGFAF